MSALNKFLWLVLLSLCLVDFDAQAIQPRGEGTGNAKHPLLKKLGESPIFQGHIRQIKLQKAHEKSPRSIFENPKKPDESAISIPVATGAAALHQLGHRGKGMTIAIIEGGFSRKTIADLVKKKLLHKDAHHLHLPYQGDLEKLDIKALARKSYELKSQIILERDLRKREALIQERGRVKNVMNYKAFVRYTLQTESELENHRHGDMVLEAAHKMAPEATILPIQINPISKKAQYFLGALNENPFQDDEGENDPISLKEFSGFLKAIQRAIDAKADVINLSFGLGLRTSANVKPIALALKKARDAGIAIIIGAGNESTDEAPISFSLESVKQSELPQYVKSLVAYMLEALNYQGALVAGSIGYLDDGRAVVSYFSQVPVDQKSENVFLLAPGQQLRLCGEETQGTSLSTPLIAGAYALLKSYALKYNIPLKNPQDLLQVLRVSGENADACYWTALLDKAASWPTLNVMAACQLLEERVKDKK